MENVEQETIKMEETRKEPSKSEVIGSFIGMGMVGFCFGIGLMLAVKTVNNLENQEEENQVTKEPQQITKEPQGKATQVQ